MRKGIAMYKYRVTVDDVKSAPSAKGNIGFANMDIRFLITDKMSGAQELSLFRTVFPPGFSAHKKHYHKDIEEVMFGIRGHGVVGVVHTDGKVEEYDISPGVAVFVPKNAVHWFRNPSQNEEVEICGVYSAANAGEYKPEDYIYIGEITEQDKKLK
jgi:oxalate decarboxylase/phosphoglucose isomerase-like protein (cupin superfamily)